MLADWLSTLSLVFGGCCSNAITLEQLTSLYPNAGSLITLCQFVAISLQGLHRHVTWTRYGPRFKPRRIPLTPYLVQVALYYLVSLLNNLAFGYRIPMSVHIIFRSGGLVISMLMGWMVAGKKYNMAQVISIVVVTLGVVLTTLSASKNPSSLAREEQSLSTYLTGIAILTLALVFAGCLGLAQDYTYSNYGRPALGQKSGGDPKLAPPPTWQESMFYLHFLALPMFVTVRGDIVSQFHAMKSSPVSTLTFKLPRTSLVSPPFSSFISRNISSPLSLHSLGDDTFAHVRLSSAVIALVLNTITQCLCSAGVNRLTTRVSSLTVTLILVVRKAVSLVLSVVFGLGRAGGRTGDMDMKMMWAGAALVMLGTIGYSFGAQKKNTKPRAKED